MNSVNALKHFALLLILPVAALFVYNSFNSLDKFNPVPVKLILPTAELTPEVGSCEPSQRVTHFVMTKIEKTGSSTLFAIFARFVLENQVNNILLQKSMFHVNWHDPRGSSWSVGPKHRNRADVLIDHARYNKTMFDKHLVKDFKYIVPVREPESWLNSAVGYYSKWSGLFMNPEKMLTEKKSAFFMERKNLNAMGFGSWYHLVQLQWLGFDYESKDNLTAIKEYIDYIVPRIDIPILNEQFDASLVIMRKRFCWEYTDLFYQNYMVNGKSKKHNPLSSKARQFLFSSEGNLGEKLLYDRINESWWSQPETKQKDFWEEVAHFQQLNYNVSNIWCSTVIKSGRSHHIEANRWHGNISITSTLCHYLQQTKGCFMSNLRKYSSGKQLKDFVF